VLHYSQGLLRGGIVSWRTGNLAASFLLVFLIPGNLMAGSGQSGAPGDSTCAACHGASTTPFASTPNGNGVFMTFSGGSNYLPGVTQSVTVTVVDNGFSQFGYQTSPRIQGQDATSGAGTLIPVDADAQFYPATPPSTLSWIAAGEGVGSTTNVFHFKWTPPASGTVVFYLIGMGGNGVDPSPEEHVYANQYVLYNTPPPAPPKPTIAQNGVLSAAASVPGLTPGAWLAIYGTNFSQATGNWSNSDFSSGKLPTTLDGVSVTIDGKPAAVYYVQPTQIDVQVPDDNARGPVNVVVTSGMVASDPVAVNMSAFAPAFFTFDGKSIAATHADNTPVNAGSPAKPGEVIVMYGTGFGPTSPATAAGAVVSGANPLASLSTLSILIGGAPAQVAFAGITAPGLYQFNLTVPATLADGDASVVATIGSLQTQAGAFIPVHN
jgi:uncharacterized protein (TIGR03437 family)